MDKLHSTSEEVTQINYTKIEDTPFTMVENNNQYALLVGNVLVTEWDTERKTRNKALIKNMTWAQITGVVMVLINNQNKQNEQ